MRLAHSRKALGASPLEGNLFHPSETPQFFGDTFSPSADGERLTTQQQRVEAIMADGFWRTLPSLSAELRRRFAGKYGEASISARIRDMRRHGWRVDRERLHSNSGLFQYRAIKLEVTA